MIDLADGTVIDVSAIASTTLSVRLSYGDVTILLPGPQTTARKALDASVVAFPVAGRSQPAVALSDAVQYVALFSGKRTTASQTTPGWPGVAVLSTARDGCIELISDGATVQVRPHR